MRAWIVEKAAPIAERPLQLRERPLPEPGAGEVRLAVEACGVCHTDLHIVEGDLPLRCGPIIPGHQIVGRVDALGVGVEQPALGERVGVTWLAGFCGTCRDCRTQRENLCAQAVFSGWDRDGGFADFAVARADVTVPLGEKLSALEAAPLLCAGVIGYRALKLAGAAAGMRVGIVGFGASARLALQVVHALGGETCVFSRSADHRERARAMGAARATEIGDSTAAECDAIVSFAPVGTVVPPALRHLRPGGTLAINAVHLTDIPSFPYSLLFEERVVRSVSHVTRADAREFLEIVRREKIRSEPVPYPFAQATEALADIKRSAVPGQAVLMLDTS